MLNRTNLTLSALSNRLNLGTRSLVLNTGVDNGTALAIRHAHHDVMRDAMAAEFVTVRPVPYEFTPSITRPATTETPRVQAWAVPTPPVAADASRYPLSSWRGWRCQPLASPGACPSPASRPRGSAAASAARALATKPRPGRGADQVGKPGAAGAASRRTVRFAAIAAIAGS